MLVLSLFPLLFQVVSIWKHALSAVLFGTEERHALKDSFGEAQILEAQCLFSDTMNMKKELLGDGHHSVRLRFHCVVVRAHSLSHAHII